MKKKIFKRLCSLISCVAFAAPLISVPAVAQAEEQPKETYKYVALGDSIAAGFGLTDGGEKHPYHAIFLTEELLKDPVREAYPAVFGEKLNAMVADTNHEVSTENLSICSYRASDIPGLLLEENYRSEESDFIIGTGFGEDTAPLAKYHDIVAPRVAEADLISIGLGANDIAIGTVYPMVSSDNVVLQAITASLVAVIEGADTKTAIATGREYLEEHKEQVTYEEFLEAVQFFSKITDNAEQLVTDAIQNVGKAVGTVKQVNPNAKIAIVGMYNPFGNSLEYNGKTNNMLNVAKDLFSNTAQILTGEDNAGELSTAAIEMPDLNAILDSIKQHTAELKKNITQATEDAKTKANALIGTIASEAAYPLQYMTLGKNMDPMIKGLNKGLKAVAEQTGSEFVDVYDIANKVGFDPHPDAEGHKQIANAMYRTLKKSVYEDITGEPWEDTYTGKTMTAGDIEKDFVPAGTVAASSDKSIAWVDETGALRAMKPGTAEITVPNEDGDYELYRVTVEKYADGSDTVGNLKILARFNDSMQFYDGHVYLLFTSYKDGVTINVDDLYGAYEISDLYYKDINENIANGSNHTGKDVDKYFTFTKDLKSMTLDRGEIVTIGMYRGFDLTTEQAALGALKNSSAWNKLVAAGKAAIVEKIFDHLRDDVTAVDEAMEELKAVFAEIGEDHTTLLDGVVEGGLCFNRELYNQKLEWDQYENVTYETDITENQLRTMMMYLGGNLNKFSILKNSCATVALRGWNAAVGTRNGEPTAYHLDAASGGIYKLMDAPKGVRDNIVKNLPGYYLNNAQGVAEPDAGYQDETGWVYVSAPEKFDKEPAGEQYTLRIALTGADKAKAVTEVYTVKNGEKTVIDGTKEIAAGTSVYVRSELDPSENNYVLGDITLDGASIMDAGHYDGTDGAYVFEMPESSAKLQIIYKEVSVTAKKANLAQISVGDSLNASDYAELTGVKGLAGDKLRWEILNDDDGVLEADGDALRAAKPGSAEIWVCADGNGNIGIPFSIEVYENTANMVKVTYNSGGYTITASADGVDRLIPFPGYLVKKNSILRVNPAQTEAEVISSVKVNGKNVGYGSKIIANGDANIEVSFREAEIKGVPDKITLADKDASHKLNASVRYSGIIAGILPVYDKTIRYTSSDPLVNVDANGLITVTDDIPEGGRLVYVTAYAGSGNDKVYARCKVIVGDYNGEKIVGKMTIFARAISKNELIPHGAVIFTSYEDADLDISYYNYFKPNEKYKALMEDYRDHPEKYPSDPALYNNNELGLDDREAYFDIITNGAMSAPAPVSLKAGESLSMTIRSYDETNLDTAIGTFLGGQIIETSAEAQELVMQIIMYMYNGEYDGTAVFDSLLGTLRYIYNTKKKMGFNPLNGHTDGGVDINKEMYNQFVKNEYQFPNDYYTVEITADELAMLRTYLADPENNYYSVFVMNCGTAAVNMWNAALFDRPELQIKFSITELGVDPILLYLKLAQMRLDKSLGGEGGTNFYPRTVAYKTAEPGPAPAKAPLTSTTVDRADGWIFLTSATREDLRGKIVAFGIYDENDKVLAAGTAAQNNITGAKAIAAIKDNAAAAYIKVFVWDSMTNLTPLCNTEVIGLN